jgi:hypothetical protein
MRFELDVLRRDVRLVSELLCRPDRSADQLLYELLPELFRKTIAISDAMAPEIIALAGARRQVHSRLVDPQAPEAM